VPASVRIELEVSPRVSLALQQQGVPFIRAIRLVNPGAAPVDGLEVEVRADPPFLAPFAWRLDQLAAGGSRAVETRALQLAPSFLASQAEREAGFIEVVARLGGEVVAQARSPVEVLAPTEWTGVGVLPELLAAFVRPNARVLTPVLQEASARLLKRLGDGALCGYQKHDTVHAAAVVQACWEALQAVGVTYINPPASFEQGGQKIRTHEDVLERRLGTCLDLTVLLAALFEQAGLHPVLVVVQGHAFVGAWLTEFRLPEPLLDDPLPLRKRVELREAVVVDSSPVTSGGSFLAAVDAAERQLGAPGSFVLAIDVASARSAAAPVLPLPLDRTGVDLITAVSQPVMLRPAAGETVPLDRFRANPAAGSPARVLSRLDRWQQRLLDLSLRNRLLNHRSGGKSLPIPRADLAALEDALASGELLQISPRSTTQAPRQQLTPEEVGAELHRHALQQQAHGRLLVDLPPAEFDKHALELFRLSRSAMEETGATVLYVALGFLSWFESAASTQPRMAPLILVPVELVRPAGVGGPWTLRGSEEETRVNVTLVQKLKAEFGIDLSALDVAPTDGAGVDVSAILDAFRRAVLEQPRWEVVSSSAIATFSFSKFLMWLDLAAKRDQILASTVVRRLVEGKDAPASTIALVAEGDVEQTRPPQEVFAVVDADPSQLRAVLAAQDGASFVLQGPPGTGKSQTITNLVAQLVANGKTVLFVSEKLAALEVVHTRLARAGLGAFCLELHSDKSSRAQVVRQLSAPFDLLATRDAEAWQSHAADLASARATLDAHARRLASPTPFGVSLRAVVGELLGLSDVPMISVSAPMPADVAGLRRLEALIERLDIALREAEPVANHPFAGVVANTWTPAWEDDAIAATATLLAATDRIAEAVPRVAEALRLPSAGAVRATVDRLVGIAEAILSAPEDVPPSLVDPHGAPSRFEEVARLSQEGRALRKRRDAWLNNWAPPLLHDPELPSLQATFQRWATGFFLFAWFALWGPRRRLVPLRQGTLPGAPAVAAELADGIDLRGHLETLSAQSQRAAAWLGARWREADSDWDDVDRLVAWAKRFHAARAALAVEVDDIHAVARATSLVTDGAVLLTSSSPTREALVELVDAASARAAAGAGFERQLGVAPERLASTAAELSSRLRRMLAERGRLRTWCHAAGVAEAVRSAGLGGLLDAVLEGTLARPALQRGLARSLRERWWKETLNSDPLLASFSGFRHEEAVQRFRKLDQDGMKLAQAEVVRRLVARLPDLHAPGEEMNTLRRQLQLQRNHLAPRKLFTRLPTVLKRIKPVVLMSPQSVARFLDPSLEGYDVVVFDEASQIPPWDAVGAIARGKQAVIVGDSKQLPPTSFFDKAEEDEEALLDDEAVEEMESVLDEATASNLDQLQLRWHYRSRHESLITFSNRHYYDGRLHTFPSADERTEGLGVELRPLPSGTYDRGGSRTNRAEADAVVEEIERQLDLPDDLRPSVGVVTFSMAQQRLVQDLTDALRRRRPELERFFAESVVEPVFIKNLENVQGDERDVMLFSIGYGADRSGKLTMSFGPVNRKGGERRLNVAITRARSRLIVFSSLNPDQIDLNRTSAVGARHLRAFLRFARDGVRALDAEALADDIARFESPFEQQVYDALVASGHAIHTQVGCSGYRVDLGVVDPDRPGRYLLGIECDGAAYHSSRNARERDRLRQAVLENLGWTMVRVWSTDWWFDREKQVKRIEEAIEAARRAPRRTTDARPSSLATTSAKIESTPPLAPSQPTVAERLSAAPPRPALPPVAVAYAGLPSVPVGVKESFYEARSRGPLGLAVLTVVREAGPVHREAVWRHVAAAWGFQSLGSRISAQLDEAMTGLPVADRPVRRGEFLWPAQLAPAALQIWRPSETGERSAGEVAPEEIGRAAVWVVSRSLAIDPDSLMVETARLFGWWRTGKHVAAAIGAGIDAAVEHGWMRRDGTRLVMGP
jgi:very-short-patch-repair endonuclease